VTREFPKHVQLLGVATVAYKSRKGGAVQLRFEGNRFVFVHMATVADFNAWTARIGTYEWVLGSWKSAPDRTEQFRVYRIVEGS
jgi:hypothetical protein